MKEYTVVPNVDATTWMVKVEDVAPVHEFDKRDDAVEKAKELAAKDQPAKVSIFDNNNEIIETEVYS